jgi:prophage regulatory protein
MHTPNVAPPTGAHVHELKRVAPLKRAADLARYERLLKLREVAARTSLSRTAIYDLQKRNLFPAAVCTGARSVAWKESEIEAWIAALPRTAIVQGADQ